MEQKERQGTKFGSLKAFYSYLFLSGEANYPFFRSHCHTHSFLPPPRTPPLHWNCCHGCQAWLLSLCMEGLAWAVLPLTLPW